MNKAILMGRLTKDPDVRYTSGTNTMVATFTLAINRRFVKEGEERQADFIQIVAWGKLAEFCNNHFKKGQQVAVIGRIQTRNYDDLDGKRVYVTEVIAEEAYFADSKREVNSTEQILNTSQPIQNSSAPFDMVTPVTDDDLPF